MKFSVATRTGLALLTTSGFMAAVSGCPQKDSTVVSNPPVDAGVPPTGTPPPPQPTPTPTQTGPNPRWDLLDHVLRAQVVRSELSGATPTDPRWDFEIAGGQVKEKSPISNPPDVTFQVMRGQCYAWAAVGEPGVSFSIDVYAPPWGIIPLGGPAGSGKTAAVTGFNTIPGVPFTAAYSYAAAGGHRTICPAMDVPFDISQYQMPGLPFQLPKTTGQPYRVVVKGLGGSGAVTLRMFAKGKP